MKFVTYHYIRNKDKLFPYQKSITKKKFNQNLKFFNKSGLVNNYDELLDESEKYLLTFDDGLKDHIYAAELLKKNNATGIFFITSYPLLNQDILDVHKSHLVTSKVKGEIILNELQNYLKKNKIKNFENRLEKEKYKDSYKKQLDDNSTKIFKRTMNYYGDIRLKHKILNYLLKKFDINIKSKDYYLNKKEIKYLSSLGMIIGSHTHDHHVLSRLSYKKQFSQIKNSKVFLEKIINKKIDIFCYPYGSKLSYNRNTIDILKKLKFKNAFTTLHGNVNHKDILKTPFEIPRYDCNIF